MLHRQKKKIAQSKKDIRKKKLSYIIILYNVFQNDVTAIFIPLFTQSVRQGLINPKLNLKYKLKQGPGEKRIDNKSKMYLTYT